MTNIIDLNNFDTTYYTSNPDSITITDKCITDFVLSEKDRYEKGRQERERYWELDWASYLSTPKGEEAARKAQEINGDINTRWRHRLSTAKSFELVETAVAYYQGAFFPNSEWFSFSPTQEKFRDIARLLEKYVSLKLDKAEFGKIWELNIRQACIVGTSAIAFPWKTETKPTKYRKAVRDGGGNIQGFQNITANKVEYDAPDFKLISLWDLFLNPDADDPNESSLIRRIVTTKANILNGISSGLYDTDPKNVYEMEHRSESEYYRRSVKHFMGVEESTYCPTDEVELFEFWGDVSLEDIHFCNVVATVMGDHLIRFEPNPYHSRPIVVTRHTAIPNEVYGYGLLDPVLGSLHQLNNLTNHRLDSMEVALNPMFTLVDDGTIDEEDLYAEPGKVIKVRDHNAIQPIRSSTDFQISITEQQLLEQGVDQATGLLGSVGMSPVRNSERVTATEVEATRSAGGQRLSQNHRHMERYALIPLLKKVYLLCRQFVSQDELIQVTGLKDLNGATSPDQKVLATIRPEAFMLDMEIIPQGAGHIANKEVAFQSLMNFVSIAAGNPAMNVHVDWMEILKKIASMSNLENIETFIKPYVGLKQQFEQQKLIQELQTKLAPPQQQPQLQQQPEIPEEYKALGSVPPDMQPTSPEELQAYREGGVDGVLLQRQRGIDSTQQELQQQDELANQFLQLSGRPDAV